MSENAVVTFKDTAGLVEKYVRNIRDQEVAMQFATHLSIMAQKDPKIKEVDPNSLVTAMLACAHLGLLPNTPEQYAFLIPYNKQLQFQVGYKGLVELAYRSGKVKTINAEIVFEGDEFEPTLGTNRALNHKPNYKVDRTDIDKAVAVYATAQMDSGEYMFEVLSMNEINKVRSETVKATKDDSPWKKWPEAMMKKTSVKRLTKLLPSSAKDRGLEKAAYFDSLAEAGKLGVDDRGDIIEVEPVKQPDNRDKVAKALKERKELPKDVEPKKEDEEDQAK